MAISFRPHSFGVSSFGVCILGGRPLLEVVNGQLLKPKPDVDMFLVVLPEPDL